MGAKDLIVRPISAQEANALVRRVHYSGKVVKNSQLHLGVFLNGRLEGAMQFGPSLDKRKLQGLVEGTSWNGFLELNRMAFSDVLPRNAESRALAVALRLIRRHAPHVQWVVSFADATQCGDGTIYRAAGFVLTGIKPNDQIWQAPEAEARFSRLSLTDQSSTAQKVKARSLCRVSATKGPAVFSRKGPTSVENPLVQARAVHALHASGVREPGATGRMAFSNGAASMKNYAAAGFRPLPGFQLRYVYFLDPAARDRLTVPILPFSEIERRGAGMYRGKARATSIEDAPAIHAGEGGSQPTVALQGAD